MTQCSHSSYRNEKGIDSFIAIAIFESREIRMELDKIHSTLCEDGMVFIVQKSLFTEL